MDLIVNFVLYSESESLANDEEGMPVAGYWNNDFGWVTLEQATRFSAEEAQKMSLPIAAERDACWFAVAG